MHNMSFENPGFESFEQNEKTKEQLIQEIKDLGGFESEEAREAFGKWIDQEQEKVSNTFEGLKLNIAIAEIYSGVGDTENAIDAYYDVIDHAENEGMSELALSAREALEKLRS